MDETIVSAHILFHNFCLVIDHNCAICGVGGVYIKPLLSLREDVLVELLCCIGQLE